MTPKLIDLTRKRNGQIVTVNPRRINRIFEVEPPSCQLYLAGQLGTEIVFLGDERLVVSESPAAIKRLLR